MKKKLSGIKSVKAISPGLAFVPAINAVATLKSSKTAKNAEITPPDAAVEKLFGNTDDAVLWGTNNLFPNEWEEEIEKNDTLTDAIEKEVDRIMAGGIEYYYDDIDADGKKVVKYFIDEEIEELLYNPISQAAFEQIVTDYIKHRLPAAELLFEPTKAKCIAISGIPAAHFRWGQQDNKGFINFSYFNRNWKLGRKSDSPDTIKIAVIDPLIDTVDIIRSEPKILKYVYRVPIASHRTYYPLSPAYVAKTSKWLPITNKVADYFDFALDNQMSPKYHLEVDEEWLRKKYGERWETADSEEMNKIFFEELSHFNTMMHGLNNSGKNIMTAKKVNAIMNKEYSSWTITEFKGSIYEKGWIELLKEGVLHVVKSVGLDPTIQGGNTSSGMGGGSGSDKREAFNIRMATASRHVNNILHPFYFALKYNGKVAPNGSRIKLQMVTPSLQVLNSVSPNERSTTLPSQK